MSLYETVMALYLGIGAVFAFLFGIAAAWDPHAELDMETAAISVNLILLWPIALLIVIEDILRH